MEKTLKSKARPSRRERKQTAIKQKEKTAKAQNAENIKENEQSKKLLVFDTSALNAVDFFEVIAEYKKVILCDIVRKEMDNKKKFTTVFGANIRKFFKKFVRNELPNVVTAEVGEIDNMLEETVDEKVVWFCKQRNAVLYSADNAQLANAKEKKVKYIIAKKEGKRVGTHTLEEAVYQNQAVYLKIPTTDKRHYIIIREGKKLKLEYLYKIKLEINDRIIVLTPKLKYKDIVMVEFLFVANSEEDHCSLETLYRNINNINIIEKLELPKEAKTDIINYIKRSLQTYEILGE